MVCPDPPPILLNAPQRMRRGWSTGKQQLVTEVPQVDRTRPITSLWSVLAVAAIAAGCSTGTSAAPASSPAHAPSTPGARTMVSGTEDCRLDDTNETFAGEVRTTRATLICSGTMSDPRVSGTARGDIKLVYVKFPGLEVNHWSAELTLESEGGTWRGSTSGSDFWDEAGALHNTGTGLYFGEGAYEGLSYRMFFAQSPDWNESIVSGWIEPSR